MKNAEKVLYLPVIVTGNMSCNHMDADSADVFTDDEDVIINTDKPIEDAAEPEAMGDGSDLNSGSAAEDDYTDLETPSDNADTCIAENESDNTENPSAEVSISSIFGDDIYEEEYGDMIAPRIQKMTAPKKKNPKNVSKTVGVDKEQKPIHATSPFTTPQNSMINKYFMKNGFLVTGRSALTTIAAVREITYLIGENYASAAPLLKEIRKSICMPNKKGERIVSLTIENHATSYIYELMDRFKKGGVVSKCNLNRNKLTATISPVPRVICYLTGHWLELYAAYILEEVVSRYAREHDYPYEIAMNLKVSDITSIDICAHELDCVLAVSDKLFACEVKSGQFDDYYTLYKTRKELHFVPDRYLLLSTSLDEKTAETLQYFYEFYISDLSCFKRRVLEMLDKAFSGESHNEKCYL